MAEHRIERGQVHYKWDNAQRPVIEIASGDVVHCETDEVTDGQIRPGSPASALGTIDFARLYPLAGPIFVRGAEPGDTLRIDILSLGDARLGMGGPHPRAWPAP